MTMMFLLVSLGSTDKRAPQGFAPIAIGLGLTLIHLISIPVTNTSVNPARSTGVALFVGDWAIAQLWLFWVAPIPVLSLALDLSVHRQHKGLIDMMHSREGTAISRPANTTQRGKDGDVGAKRNQKRDMKLDMG